MTIPKFLYDGSGNLFTDHLSCFPMAKRGQPTKYSEELTQEICKYVSEGLSLKDSCLLAGIGETTRCEWQKKYPEFSKALTVAELKWKSERIKRIQIAGSRARTTKDGAFIVEGDWKADMALLKTRFKEEFSEKIQHDVAHSIDTGMENAFRLIDAIVDAAKASGSKPKRKSRRVSKDS